VSDPKLAVLRRALALSSTTWDGDLYALVGDAIDRVDGSEGQLALDVLRELQRTVQPGEPFGDPSAWARRARVDEVRRAIEATLERLRETT